jgi:hypothetical protein
MDAASTHGRSKSRRVQTNCSSARFQRSVPESRRSCVRCVHCVRSPQIVGPTTNASGPATRANVRGRGGCVIGASLVGRARPASGTTGGIPPRTQNSPYRAPGPLTPPARTGPPVGCPPAGWPPNGCPYVRSDKPRVALSPERNSSVAALSGRSSYSTPRSRNTANSRCGQARRVPSPGERWMGGLTH